jgi:hypothetical protein
MSGSSNPGEVSWISTPSKSTTSNSSASNSVDLDTKLLKTKKHILQILDTKTEDAVHIPPNVETLPNSSTKQLTILEIREATARSILQDNPALLTDYDIEKALAEFQYIKEETKFLRDKEQGVAWNTMIGAKNFYKTNEQNVAELEAQMYKKLVLDKLMRGTATIADKNALRNEVNSIRAIYPKVFEDSNVINRYMAKFKSTIGSRYNHGRQGGKRKSRKTRKHKNRKSKTRKHSS